MLNLNNFSIKNYFTAFVSSLSFSAALRARSSLFLANLESGTGLKVRSVLAQELNSPLFQCRRKLKSKENIQLTIL